MVILSRVSPLVKIVDQTQCEAATSDKLLHFLLNEALTGNSRTVLIYCIHPQGKHSTSTNLTRILWAQRWLSSSNRSSRWRDPLCISCGSESQKFGNEGQPRSLVSKGNRARDQRRHHGSKKEDDVTGGQWSSQHLQAGRADPKPAGSSLEEPY